MLIKTHIAIAIFFIILLFGYVDNPLLFPIITLLATLIPDIDTTFSSVGKYKIFRFLQIFTKHRGFIHSFTLCIVLSVLFMFFVPVIAFPFFLGYALHLFLDSFTKEGITPFWPYSRKAEWRIRTGGRFEELIFFLFIALDIIVLILKFR